MKRYWIITAVVLLLAVAVPLAVIYWPHTLSEEECSPLYRQYVHVEGVKASYIKGYRVNDTLALDVTLLSATDTIGWEMLVEDFELPAQSDSLRNNPSYVSVLFWKNKKGQSRKERDTTDLNNDFLAASRAQRTICIFHVTDSNQWRFCLDNQIKKTVSSI